MKKQPGRNFSTQTFDHFLVTKTLLSITIVIVPENHFGLHELDRDRGNSACVRRIRFQKETEAPNRGSTVEEGGASGNKNLQIPEGKMRLVPEVMARWTRTHCSSGQC